MMGAHDQFKAALQMECIESQQKNSKTNMTFLAHFPKRPSLSI